MSGLVSSLVSSLSLLTAASVSETTVVFNGCVSIVVGCCSIIGRYPPGSVDQCVGRSGYRCTNPSYACEQVSTSMRAETLVLVGTILARTGRSRPGGTGRLLPSEGWS